MGLFSSKKFKAKAAGMSGGRSAEDYGIPDMTDATLQILAGDPGRYGEESAYARKELSARQKLMGDANVYRAALERSAFGDFGRQYGAGLNQITSTLARSGPLADSGAATALRARLASQLYGQAQSKILGGYADYLRQLQMQRRGFNYQRALLQYQKSMTPSTSWAGGVLGTAAPIVAAAL